MSLSTAVDFRYIVFCDDSEGSDVCLFGTNNRSLAFDYVFDEASSRSSDVHYAYHVVDTSCGEAVLHVGCFPLKSN